jgi:hypothetical protein
MASCGVIWAGNGVEALGSSQATGLRFIRSRIDGSARSFSNTSLASWRSATTSPGDDKKIRNRKGSDTPIFRRIGICYRKYRARARRRTIDRVRGGSTGPRARCVTAGRECQSRLAAAALPGRLVRVLLTKWPPRLTFQLFRPAHCYDWEKSRNCKGCCWRPRPELNRCTRFCRPLRNHSATWPHCGELIYAAAPIGNQAGQPRLRRR